MSKLVSTSQLSYYGCANLLVAKNLDGGSVALVLSVIIEIIITENCSRMEKKLFAQSRSLNSNFSSGQNKTFPSQRKASYTFSKDKCPH